MNVFKKLFVTRYREQVEFRHECLGDVEVIESGMVSAAGSIFAFESRKQPDWFKVSSVVLSELIKKHNAIGKWLSSGANCDRQRYVVQHRLACCKCSEKSED